MPTSNIVPFGKYRGQPVEVLANDRQYVEWLMAQSWFKDKFGATYNLIVNNFAEPTETPEHNALQAKFLDIGLCTRLALWLKLGQPGDCCHRIERREQGVAANWSGADDRGWNHSPEAARGTWSDEGFDYRTTHWCDIAPRFSFKQFFESHGFDVALRISTECPCCGYSFGTIRVAVELKPSLGDDYPAVLRQVKRALGTAERDDVRFDYTVLIFDQFAARGANTDQVKAIFRASRIDVAAISEILDTPIIEPGFSAWVSK